MGNDNIDSPKVISRKKKLIIGILAVVVAMLIAAISYVMKSYGGAEAWVKIPVGASDSQIKDQLNSVLGAASGDRVYSLWKLQGGEASKANGAYLIRPGDYCIKIARRLYTGRQTPVKATWNEARTLEDMAYKITANLECSAKDFIETSKRVLADSGFTTSTFPAAFFPDTYEFYWNVTPKIVVKKLLESRNNFWNDERKAKAKEIGLSPEEITTIASIVEEESAKRDEYGKIARLYINRIEANMPLQADPTVKFAVGDPTIRRVTEKHTAVNSPYNTYKNKGLPPGPIRFVDKRTIDAVLTAPKHDYIYMCAKEDFSGYHNFAKEYSRHLENARLYQTELNRRNIR